MTDIEAFLTARLDEDEAIARAASAGPWSVGGGGYEGDNDGCIEGAAGQDLIRVAGDPGGYEAVLSISDAEHIVRWNPVRVLAEIAAKRAILEIHAPHDSRILAAVWAGHPDYRQEWKP
jgi:hypothetical protein